MKLRQATHADAAAIVALEEHFPSDRISPRSVRGFLRSASAQVWVAAERGEVLACLILLTRSNSRVARIYSVVVSASVRGRGLGARLVSLAEQWARKRGSVCISLEVREDNAPARALYAKLGYSEHAMLPGYYDDGAPGLRLRKPLRVRARGAGGRP